MFAWHRRQVSLRERDRRDSFERRITRPHFHVKPLDDAQLHAWSEYLDFEEAQAAGRGEGAGTESESQVAKGKKLSAMGTAPGVRSAGRKRGREQTKGGGGRGEGSATEDGSSRMARRNDVERLFERCLVPCASYWWLWERYAMWKVRDWIVPFLFFVLPFYTYFLLFPVSHLLYLWLPPWFSAYSAFPSYAVFPIFPIVPNSQLSLLPLLSAFPLFLLLSLLSLLFQLSTLAPIPPIPPIPPPFSFYFPSVFPPFFLSISFYSPSIFLVSRFSPCFIFIFCLPFCFPLLPMDFPNVYLNFLRYSFASIVLKIFQTIHG